MDDFDRSNDYTRGEDAEGKSGRGRNRTRDQKGLRDRISPYCTLSQNGYGAGVCEATATLDWSSTPGRLEFKLQAGWNLNSRLCRSLNSRLGVEEGDRERERGQAS